MTPKAARFVEEYLVDLNATKAAQRAGYSARTAGSAGQRLLKKVEIAAALEERQKQRAMKTEITAERVLQELGLIGFGDIRGVFDEQGRLRPISDLPEPVARTVASVEVLREKTTRLGESSVEECAIKVKAWDKLRALELIGRHLAMWKDRMELEQPMPFQIELTDYGSAAPYTKPTVSE